MIISSSLPILLPHLPWHFVIFWGRCLRRTSTNSFGGLTLKSWNRILCWTWLHSAITLVWGDYSFTTLLLSAKTIGWKANSFTTWLLSAITIGRDDELFVLAETSSSLSIKISGLGEVLIFWHNCLFVQHFSVSESCQKHLACNFETLWHVLFSLNGPIMPSSTWHKKIACKL